MSEDKLKEVAEILEVARKAMESELSDDEKKHLIDLRNMYGLSNEELGEVLGGMRFAKFLVAKRGESGLLFIDGFLLYLSGVDLSVIDEMFARRYRMINEPKESN